jgi:CDP-diacylglycerol---glycerol-3-phosphate 3-phosphatidyltransferase
MNLPNKLTMIRILIIPIIVILFLLRDYLGKMQIQLIIMGILFVIAAITDYFDGKIARKRNIVTTFGKFIDPLADKLLVITALLIFHSYYITYSGTILSNSALWMPFWVIWVIISRELIVTSIRLVAIGEGKVLPAGKLGKYKAAFTMITLVYYFFVMPLDISVINIIGIIFVNISVILTIISGIDYFIKNKNIILKEI